jgi:hypothetical protein
MASEIVRRFMSDRSEDVDVDDSTSTLCSGVGRIVSSVLSLSSDTSSELTDDDSASSVCQCPPDVNALVECLECGSYRVPRMLDQIALDY